MSMSTSEAVSNVAETPTSPDLSETSVLPLPAPPLQCALPSLLRSRNGPMQWPPVLSTFVLTRMVELVKGGADLGHGIKEATLADLDKNLLLFCGAKVSNSQVYNHLRKWRSRWNMLRELAKVEGVEWREESSSFYMDEDVFVKHVTLHPKDECFINTPIANYDQMKAIFGKPRVKNPLSGDTLHLALSHLMDHEEERDHYLNGTKQDRKKWYFAFYRAHFNG